MSKSLRITTLCLQFSTFVLACALTSWAIAPTKWVLSGSNPAGYESGIDSATKYTGLPSTYLQGKSDNVEGFGTLMLTVRGSYYTGMRLRPSASAKSKSVRQRAGLWMRVDKSRDATPLAFDNMFNRPIRGSTDWQNYQVVLDVPADASSISFGILLAGPGKVWLADVKLNVVGPNFPTTGMPIEKQKWQHEHPSRMEPGWTPVYD
jgi:hypothetical protein